MTAAAATAVAAWRANHPDAGWLLVRLPADERHTALVALGLR